MWKGLLAAVIAALSVGALTYFTHHDRSMKEHVPLRDDD